MEDMPLVTRVQGLRVEARLQPSGFGPLLWVGEFAPEPEHRYLTSDGEPFLEMRVARSLDALLDALARVAPLVQDRPLQAA